MRRIDGTQLEGGLLYENKVDVRVQRVALFLRLDDDVEVADEAVS